MGAEQGREWPWGGAAPGAPGGRGRKGQPGAEEAWIPGPGPGDRHPASHSTGVDLGELLTENCLSQGKPGSPQNLGPWKKGLEETDPARLGGERREPESYLLPRVIVRGAQRGWGRSKGSRALAHEWAHSREVGAPPPHPEVGCAWEPGRTAQPQVQGFTAAGAFWLRRLPTKGKRSLLPEFPGSGSSPSAQSRHGAPSPQAPSPQARSRWRHPEGSGAGKTPGAGDHPGWALKERASQRAASFPPSSVQGPRLPERGDTSGGSGFSGAQPPPPTVGKRLGQEQAPSRATVERSRKASAKALDPLLPLPPQTRRAGRSPPTTGSPPKRPGREKHTGLGQQGTPENMHGESTWNRGTQGCTEPPGRQADRPANNSHQHHGRKGYKGQADLVSPTRPITSQGQLLTLGIPIPGGWGLTWKRWGPEGKAPKWGARPPADSSCAVQQATPPTLQATPPQGQAGRHKGGFALGRRPPRGPGGHPSLPNGTHPVTKFYPPPSLASASPTPRTIPQGLDGPGASSPQGFHPPGPFRRRGWPAQKQTRHLDFSGVQISHALARLPGATPKTGEGKPSPAPMGLPGPSHTPLRETLSLPRIGGPRLYSKARVPRPMGKPQQQFGDPGIRAPGPAFPAIAPGRVVAGRAGRPWDVQSIGGSSVRRREAPSSPDPRARPRGAWKADSGPRGRELGDQAGAGEQAQAEAAPTGRAEAAGTRQRWGQQQRRRRRRSRGLRPGRIAGGSGPRSGSRSEVGPGRRREGGRGPGTGRASPRAAGSRVRLGPLSSRVPAPRLSWPDSEPSIRPDSTLPAWFSAPGPQPFGACQESSRCCRRGRRRVPALGKFLQEEGEEAGAGRGGARVGGVSERRGRQLRVGGRWRPSGPGRACARTAFLRGGLRSGRPRVGHRPAAPSSRARASAPRLQRPRRGASRASGLQDPRLRSAPLGSAPRDVTAGWAGPPTKPFHPRVLFGFCEFPSVCTPVLENIQRLLGMKASSFSGTSGEALSLLPWKVSPAVAPCGAHSAPHLHASEGPSVLAPNGRTSIPPSRSFPESSAAPCRGSP
ncbi:collagen alpha-1(I) chain-like [Sarcophilus harrisii]|uniref:collagen alpha-1(I) chain-like n=1 Tax=Sarcophilus harrisii TaxID=9305 RepID=UPI001301B0E6|nr:collagen alpha-1(I) chain-like [Sarcophilus harrisii]